MGLLAGEVIMSFREVSDEDVDEMLDLEIERDLDETVVTFLSLSQSFLQFQAFDPDSGKCLHHKALSHAWPTSFTSMHYHPLNHFRSRFVQWL